MGFLYPSPIIAWLVHSYTQPCANLQEDKELIIGVEDISVSIEPHLDHNERGKDINVVTGVLEGRE